MNIGLACYDCVKTGHQGSKLRLMNVSQRSIICHGPLQKTGITLFSLKQTIMKGNDKIIERLNTLLADELTAIGQYIVHSEMCANWGYGKLHDAIKKRAIGEMRHAEKLIERILFLEGIPDVSGMEKVVIGNDVEQQFKNDRNAETGANKAYNDSIRLCYELNDNGTMELLQSILTDEEEHLDWLETQLSLMDQIGSTNYLVEQVG